MNGVYVGRWIVTAQGRHELHYDQEWMDSEVGRPISLSMPFRPSAPYANDVVRNFFANLLPDNETIRRRIAQRFGTTTETFNLLAEIGRDCVGALQMLPERESPKDPFGIEAARLSESGIERRLSRALTETPLQAADADQDFRISLAGNQEKTALLRWEGHWCVPHGSTPTTHIFKLPMGIMNDNLDMTTSVENEWLCSRILRAYGIACAESEIGTFGRHRVLIVTRFDRRARPRKEGFERLPQEDFAQVLGVDPDRKYEANGGPGIEAVMGQLNGSMQREADRSDFFRTQVLFWMLAAVDGHAKNFSIFIQRQGRFNLTPRYDVLSAYPVMGHKAGKLAKEKIKMAMAVRGKNRHYEWAGIRRRHFEQTASLCRLPDAPAIINDLVARTPKVVEQVGAELPRKFPAEVADPILEGLTAAAGAMGSSK